MPRNVSDTHELQPGGESAPPLSAQVQAGRTVYHRLVEAFCQLPQEATEAEALAHLLEAFAEVLPGYALAVTLAATAQSDAVVLSVPPLTVPAGEPWTAEPRLFRMFAHERRIVVGAEVPECRLYCAYNDPALDKDDSPPSRILQTCADVLAAALRHVRAQRALRRLEGENEQLRRMAIQNEKLASLGEISAGLVHELSNPLTSIVAYTDYLRQKAERRGGDPEDIERLGRVGEAANLILSFTRAIIAYARPATEPQTSVAIDEVVEQALLFCKHSIDQTGVSVIRDVAPGLPRVLAVRGQLTQVIVNLVTNACQAMEAEGGQLHIGVSCDASVRAVVLRVRDTGPGIPTQDVSQVFDPFFTTKSAGTGLGLNIVRQIVEQHGGTIAVESGPERGATFIVILPVAG